MEKKKIALVSLGHLCCDINAGALPASLPYVRAAHGLDYEATGGLIFAYSCLSSITQPLLGWLSDRHSKPWFIPLGILLAGAGITLMAFMSHYWAMFACLAISGIGSAFFHPEGARFANKVSGETKGMGMSLFSIGGNAGFIFGPLIVALFVGGLGLAGMSVFVIMAIVMAALLLWQIARMPTTTRIDKTGLTNNATLAEKAKETQGKNDWHAFSRLVAVILSRSIMFAGCNTFIPLYFVALGQTKAIGAVALVVFGACGVACNMLGGYFADRVGYVNVIRAGFLAMPPTLLAVGAAGLWLDPSWQIWLCWPLLPLLGFGLYLPFSSQVVLGQKLLARNIGFASGVTFGISTTVGGMCQPLLGWLADSVNISAVFLALACVGLFGCAFTFMLKKELDSQETPHA